MVPSPASEEAIEVCKDEGMRPLTTPKNHKLIENHLDFVYMGKWSREQIYPILFNTSISNTIKYGTHSVLFYTRPFQNLYIHLHLFLWKVTVYLKRKWSKKLCLKKMFIWNTRIGQFCCLQLLIRNKFKRVAFGNHLPESSIIQTW